MASPGSFARWPWWRRWFGTQAERTAAAYLRRQGHRILAANYSRPSGELDLVTLDSGVIVFVEVRSTASDDALRPAASVDAEKQRRLTRAAIAYLTEHRLLDRSARFDVLTIHWPSDQSQPEITHYQHAFEAVGQWQMYQ